MFRRNNTDSVGPKDCFGNEIPPAPVNSTPDPKNIVEPSGVPHQAKILLSLLVLRAWGWNWEVPAWDKDAHLFMFVVCILELIFWAWVVYRVSQPNAFEKKLRAQRLAKALANPASSGLSKEWYESTLEWIEKWRMGLSVTSVGVLVVLYYTSYPQSPLDQVHAGLQGVWSYLYSHFDKWELFAGLVIGHYIVLWTLIFLYGILDLTRPEWALPFKCQEDVVVTKKEFLAAVAGTALNCVGTMLTAWAIYQVYPYIAPNAWSETIPSLPTMILQMAAGAVFTDIGYYYNHLLMHTTWGWTYFHYVHHQWKAPIAASVFYTHPVEHFVLGVPVVLAGPVLFGFHLLPFGVWVAIATFRICYVHSGWHLPLLPSPEFHDYHHWEGYDCLGAGPVLDSLHGTNHTWMVSWQRYLHQTFTTPDYPVNKILARKGELGPFAPNGIPTYSQLHYEEPLKL